MCYFSPFFKRALSSVVLFLLAALVGCTSSSDSDVGDSQLGTGEFLSQCGTLVDGELRNPVSQSAGVAVTIREVAGSNRLIVERDSGAQLIFLSGLADAINPVEERRARDYLSTRLGEAVFFEAVEGCTINFGGATGTAGKLFHRASGDNLTEQLLARGAARPVRSASCRSELLFDCYDSIARETVVDVGARVSSFVWKPNAERDNNLVVLFNPSASRVVVNGNEGLVLSGPSNARATTARGNRPGCGYGTNVVIEAFDSANRPLVWPGDALSFVIPNGCNREQF